MSDGAHVGGEIVNIYKSSLKDELSGPGAIWILTMVHVVYIWVYIAITVVLAAIFPSQLGTVAEASFSRPGMSILLGFVLWLLVLPVALLLVMTCIGIVLIPVQIILLATTAILGRASISAALGKKIGEIAHRPVASIVGAAALGALVIGLIRAIPILGPVIVFILTTMGVGAVVITGFGTDSEWWWKRWGRSTQSQSGPSV